MNAPNKILQITIYKIMSNSLCVFFFRFCFAPLGRSLGIKTSRSKKATPNPILDKAYNGKKIKQKQVLDKFYTVQ